MIEEWNDETANSQIDTEIKDRKTEWEKWKSFFSNVPIDPFQSWRVGGENSFKCKSLTPLGNKFIVWTIPLFNSNGIRSSFLVPGKDEKALLVI